MKKKTEQLWFRSYVLGPQDEKKGLEAKANVTSFMKAEAVIR